MFDIGKKSKTDLVKLYFLWACTALCSYLHDFLLIRIVRHYGKWTTYLAPPPPGRESAERPPQREPSAAVSLSC